MMKLRKGRTGVVASRNWFLFSLGRCYKIYQSRAGCSYELRKQSLLF